MLKIIILFIIILTGCSPESSYGNNYNIIVHPSLFSQFNEIVEASDKWTKATDVSFTFEVDENSSCYNPGTICMFAAPIYEINNRIGSTPEDGSWIGSTSRNNNDSSSILILDEVLKSTGDTSIDFILSITLKKVILHELGHALGLEHDLQKNTVMYPTVENSSLFVTCRDKQQYFGLRGSIVDC